MLQAVDIASGQVSGVDSLSSATSSLMNWEIDEAGINRPRPGLATFAVTGGLGTSPVIGMERWKNYVVFVTSDRKLWAISDANPTLAGALSDSTTATQLEGSLRPVFAIGEQYIYITGGGRIQRWQPALVFSEVLAASPFCTHIAINGQRLIANVNSATDATNASTFAWSDIGEGVFTSWPVANMATAEARPDPILAISENTSEVYVFGTETFQAYGLGSDPTFPFEQAATVNVGLGAPYAFTRLDSDYALLDNRRRIVMSDGRAAESIGDAIQKDIRSFSTVSDCWMYREERGQQSLLVIRFPTERRTFVFDLKGKKWGERDYYAAPFPADWPVSAHVYAPAQNTHLFGSALSAGGLLRFDEASRQDIGAPVRCVRVTGWNDFGTANRKRSSRQKLVLRRGTAAQNATPGAVELAAQNDEGPWSSWRQVSLGGPDQYEQHRDMFALNGVFRRRRYGLRYSNSEDTSIVALYDDVTDLGAA